MKVDAMPRTLAAVVRERTGVAWSKAKALCTDGRVSVNGVRCVDPASRVPTDAIVVIDERAPRMEKGPLARAAIVHSDRDLVVVDKPAGMLSVADEAGNKETLAEYTRTLLRKLGGGVTDARLGIVHRLDRDTSGLMVLARTASAQRHLAAQFRVHDVERVYVALVHGDAGPTTIRSDLLVDRGDGLRGSHGVFRRAKGGPPTDARHSVTHVALIERLSGATLVECRLETGRQHQIRIHLSELGHPLVGERVYARDYKDPMIDAPRVMLHARTLGFTHPRDSRRVRFESQIPDDFNSALESLRRRTR